MAWNSSYKTIIEMILVWKFSPTVCSQFTSLDGWNIFQGKVNVQGFGDDSRTKTMNINLREQLLFIDGEQLFRNPAEEMNKVQDFLDVGRELKTKNFVKE